ncbi:MAG TPA: UDP-3-O-(3-hydroxymyristoyl)glucosamine N-acyltransferase [Tepidisphaeraceae bacterium]|nr:UDP-3-O-(3-hydroxymyristoyl)glucosamine N-acyltransferase [Tepidisphaeraceae bacterium]
MLKLSQIAQLLDQPAPAVEKTIRGVAALDEADADQLGFMSSSKYASLLSETKAGAILVPDKFKGAFPDASVIFKVVDVELALAKLLPSFARKMEVPAVGVHPSAVVDPSATIDPTACIGANATIGPEVKIGARTLIHPGVVIGAASVIGTDCELHPNCVIRDQSRIGNRVNIKANAVIGSDGFGFRWDGTQHVKIPQVGIVVLEDDVEIGSCSAIDRAKFGETRVGRGTKIDNHVQIGHNVKIGMLSIICAQTGIAGSGVIGNGVVLAAGVGVANHSKIGDRVTAAARTGVAADVPPGQIIAGAPYVPHRQWLREQAAIHKLPELIERVKELEEKLAKLENPTT